MADRSRRGTPRPDSSTKRPKRQVRAQAPLKSARTKPQKVKAPKAPKAPKVAKAPKAAKTVRPTNLGVGVASPEAQSKVPQFASSKQKQASIGTKGKNSLGNILLLPFAAIGALIARLSHKDGQAGTTNRQKREQRARKAQRAKWLGYIKPVLIGVGSVAAVALLVYFVLSNSQVFSIDTITAPATEHISQDSIDKLIEIPEGTNLLNFNADEITKSLQKNPWVASVDYERQFPHDLVIHINERKIYALVLLGSDSTAWYLGEGNVWMQPLTIASEEGKTLSEVALAKAQAEGELLIYNVPASMSPQQSAYANDDVLTAVETFQNTFSDDFVSHIVAYSAPSLDAISCVLDSGIEISLGSATQIETKERVIEELIEAHPDQITYINVRTPANSSYRKVDIANVQRGTGVKTQQ